MAAIKNLHRTAPNITYAGIPIETSIHTRSCKGKRVMEFFQSIADLLAIIRYMYIYKFW